ncbi:hypothetical protein BT63DRAFT_455410 [Microthyrium microscopicum]|uniref:Uncharacterized protein n=1 Tax=Microthyrium microscopicum TaxID=703497 RepID=A0A6A6UCR0_9PEZI|nr:hypothetical protein BT63DRAFT_455410 [Microthyrium microscopicum]
MPKPSAVKATQVHDNMSASFLVLLLVATVMSKNHLQAALLAIIALLALLYMVLSASPKATSPPVDSKPSSPESDAKPPSSVSNNAATDSTPSPGSGKAVIDPDLYWYANPYSEYYNFDTPLPKLEDKDSKHSRSGSNDSGYKSEDDKPVLGVDVISFQDHLNAMEEQRNETSTLTEELETRVHALEQELQEERANTEKGERNQVVLRKSHNKLISEHRLLKKEFRASQMSTFQLKKDLEAMEYKWKGELEAKNLELEQNLGAEEQDFNKELEAAKTLSNSLLRATAAANSKLMKQKDQMAEYSKAKDASERELSRANAAIELLQKQNNLAHSEYYTLHGTALEKERIIHHLNAKIVEHQASKAQLETSLKELSNEYAKLLHSARDESLVVKKKDKWLVEGKTMLSEKGVLAGSSLLAGFQRNQLRDENDLLRMANSWPPYPSTFYEPTLEPEHVATPPNLLPFDPVSFQEGFHAQLALPPQVDLLQKLHRVVDSEELSLQHEVLMSPAKFVPKEEFLKQNDVFLDSPPKKIPAHGKGKAYQLPTPPPWPMYPKCLTRVASAIIDMKDGLIAKRLARLASIFVGKDQFLV